MYVHVSRLFGSQPQTTWDDPTVTEKEQPPPPEPEKETETKPRKKREQDQWFKINGPKKGKVWYNEETKQTQDHRPECLTKYR